MNEMTPRDHAPGLARRAAGRMTAVMRAVVIPAGPRLLRLGILRGGRVVEERLVKDLGDVTVGREESCTIAASCAPHGLFTRIDGRYELGLGPGMTAKVGLASGVREATAGEHVPLDDDARGRVSLPGGDVVLFQIVVAPVPSPRPVLPLAVRSGEGIDWSLTVLVALSFLLHFGFVGALYSDWADARVQDAPSVAGLVDMAKLAPVNVPVEAHEAETSPVAEAPKDSARPREASKSASHGGPGKSHAGPSGPSAKEAGMVASAERMAMDVLGTLGREGTASDRALKRGSDIPPVDLSAEAQKDTSVGPSGPLATRSTGPVGPGRSSDLSTLGNTRAEPGHDKAGPMRETQGPVLDTRVGTAGLTVPVSDADRVVASLRPRFRRCYEQGLANEPGMSGRAALTAKIGPNGEVTAVEVSVTGLSSAVGACLARTLRSAQFAAPGGTGSTLSVPVTLIQTNR